MTIDRTVQVCFSVRFSAHVCFQASNRIHTYYLFSSRMPFLNCTSHTPQTSPRRAPSSLWQICISALQTHSVLLSINTSRLLQMCKNMGDSLIGCGLSGPSIKTQRQLRLRFPTQPGISSTVMEQISPSRCVFTLGVSAHTIHKKSIMAREQRLVDVCDVRVKLYVGCWFTWESGYETGALAEPCTCSLSLNVHTIHHSLSTSTLQVYLPSIGKYIGIIRNTLVYLYIYPT